jgi:hypothetical protein
VDVGDTPPHAVVEHDTFQVTPLADESLVTVAANCAVLPACSVVAVLDRAMPIGGGDGLAAPPQANSAATRTAAKNTPTQARVPGDMPNLPVTTCGLRGSALVKSLLHREAEGCELYHKGRIKANGKVKIVEIEQHAVNGLLCQQYA